MDQTARMFDLQAVAERYAVTTVTVANWIRAGELKAVNVGRAPNKRKPRWRISATALAEFEARRTTTPAVPRIRRKRTGDAIAFY